MTPVRGGHGRPASSLSQRTERLRNRVVLAATIQAVSANARVLERVKERLMAAKGLDHSMDEQRQAADGLLACFGRAGQSASGEAGWKRDGSRHEGSGPDASDTAICDAEGAGAVAPGGAGLTAAVALEADATGEPSALTGLGADAVERTERRSDAGAQHDTAPDGASAAPAFGPLPQDEETNGGVLRSDWTALPLTAEGLTALPVPALLRLEARHALRRDQRPPKGDWRTWLILGGRGSGKTRAGAEWVQALATGESPVRIALIAETLADAREVMVDGASGVWRIARVNRPAFEVSRRRLVWPNGSTAQIFSSEDPESLRGPQFDFAWADEIGKWKHAEETWDMLQFGLRLGPHPRQAATTTPRATPLLKRLIAEPGAACTRLATRDNADNLAPGFIAALEQRYGGTRLGRQELDGELIEDREDALWSRSLIERSRIRAPGPMRRIVVAVDPPASEAARDSCCGVVVAGLGEDGRAVVLADCSVERASPARWADAVVRAYRRFQADRVIAEINQGGDMVTAVLRAADAHLPISTVSARRGKRARAEPAAALYEQGRVAHAGAFPALEDQMCDFGPDGLSNGASPDRLDALVWALTALMLTGAGEPRVRGV